MSKSKGDFKMHTNIKAFNYHFWKEIHNEEDNATLYSEDINTNQEKLDVINVCLGYNFYTYVGMRYIR